MDEAGRIRTTNPLDRRAIAGAIAVSAVVVQAKGHGHAGAAMGMAAVAQALFGQVMRHDPADPAWPGRDRFILSAGHASLLLYIQLFLTGYGLTIDDVAHTRLPGSPTPGHPERGHTPGVEMSTGPLGQGVASAVGLALAARRDEALFGAGTGLFDPTVWVLAGDGCLQEGVSGEASSLAGTQGLDNLVLIWDDNRVTIDGPTTEAFAEDVRGRYRAYGWRVIEVDDFLDVPSITMALQQAKQRVGKPTLVAVRSIIGWPSPAHQGKPSAHAGAFGLGDVAATLGALGFEPASPVADLLPDEVVAHCRAAMAAGASEHRDWNARHATWRLEHPGLANARDALLTPTGWSAALDGVYVAAPQATRTTSGAVLKTLQPLGLLWGGSADLSSSTSIGWGEDFVSSADPAGGQIRFGIREHAMAAILTGIALHGLWRPFASTYLVFSDYARGAIRLAAMMKLPVIYIFTHDSVAVGEDGPTHQPVEQIASLRLVPGLDVVRPADARETLAAWRRLFDAPGPVALILSRQVLPVLPVADDEAVARGGYVLWQSGSGDDPLILIATGSEVAVALAAARELADGGESVRVVSMPCTTWFEAQSAAWRHSVLPPSARRRVVIEAGRGACWHRYAGLDGAVIGVEDFGESAPGDQVLAACGITVQHVVEVCRGL